MHIVSINAAEKQSMAVGNKTLDTGIFKQPLAGTVAITALGIAADSIVDSDVHGGEDQALYLYSAEDYAWWSDQLSRELEPGCFGENLTLSSFPQKPLRVGDRLTINNGVVLEITAPRVPCLKLATRMGDPTFGKKFVAAVRPGAYARVIETGEIQVGDRIEWHPSPENHVTINDVFIEWHKKDWSEAVFKQALQSPISKISRAIIEERYTR